MNAFATYLLGVVLCVAGLAVAAFLLDVPALAIGAALAGIVAIALLVHRRRARRTRTPSS